MTFGTLIHRSLRFHARAHLGVALGAAVGSAALIGALVVGDSVRESLAGMARRRLGKIHFALATQDRLFPANLRERLAGAKPPDSADPSAAAANRAVPALLSAALTLPGIATRPDGAARVNHVQVLGVDPQSWPRLAHWGSLSPDARRRGPAREPPNRGGVVMPPPEEEEELLARWQRGGMAFINPALARKLAVRAGDELIVRMRKPSALGLDAALSPRNEDAVALRLKVGAILPSERLGDFALTAQPGPAANLFLPLDFLSAQLGVPGQANLLAAGPEWDLPRLGRELARAWQPEDAGLTVRVVAPPPDRTGGERVPPFVEICSARIFLEPSIVAAALTPRADWRSDGTGESARGPLATNGMRVLTYLANLMRAGNRATPYSMVTAAEAPLVPPDMRDDEVLINEWLADDLQVKPGDAVALSYYVVDSGSRLVERTNSFRVRQVVPLRGRYADRTLMPEFPGVAQAERTRDWDAGFSLVYPIQARDEAYWKTYRGTPKAFVTLAAGQAMWASRFGTLTAIRYPVPDDTPPDTVREAVKRQLRTGLRPDEAGLQFEAVRAAALKAAAQGQDFGLLFLGFSWFVVGAALLLMALLFQFELEQRSAEVGILLALGLTPRQVRRLLLFEGAALALAGGAIGALGGLGYAWAMIQALTTVWRGAIGSAELHFQATAASLLTGFCASTVVATLTIWLTLRRQARQPVRALLTGEIPSPVPRHRNRGPWAAAGAGAAAAGLVSWALLSHRQAEPGVFFGAGVLVLLAGLAAASDWLGRRAGAADAARLTLPGLGVRGCARRRNRSLACVALLACGSFVLLAIGVFRLEAQPDAVRRDSGTGGFALIGESTLPVVADLNTRTGRDFYGLDDAPLAGVNVVPLRVREGDAANCLNLNRAQRPRLLGVKPERLAGRFAFTPAAGYDRRWGWALLSANPRRPGALPDAVPAIGDANSIQWALGKKIGDTLDYTDELGRAFKVRLVGAVANSILQGSLLIDEAEFTRRFPGESGYRMFLVDAPADAVPRVSAVLTRALQDAGLELTPAARRLNEFNTVQNTYLGTFQALGGLGLLLGSAGLGVVVLRNVLERRGELGLLGAVGFRRRRLQWLVMAEHGVLLGLGLGLGIAAAMVAVLPALLTPGPPRSYGWLALTLAAVLLNGLLWTWLAAAAALRGNLLAALRNE